MVQVTVNVKFLPPTVPLETPLLSLSSLHSDLSCTLKISIPRWRNRVATYDETGHRTGPRKQKTQHIADAKIATGRLMADIKIGPRMVDMIERRALPTHGL